MWAEGRCQVASFPSSRRTVWRGRCACDGIIAESSFFPPQTKVVHQLLVWSVGWFLLSRYACRVAIRSTRLNIVSRRGHRHWVEQWKHDPDFPFKTLKIQPTVTWLTRRLSNLFSESLSTWAISHARLVCKLNHDNLFNEIDFRANRADNEALLKWKLPLSPY